MDFRQLRYFVAVARECNFTRAAQMLHIAQPAISRQIQHLEEQLGVELFDRSGRQPLLTPAGRFLFDRGQSILEQIELTVESTVRIGKGSRQRFEVGFSLMTLNGVLPEIIRRFREDHPHIDIGLSDLNSRQQFDALITGRIDVGFGRLSASEDGISSETIALEYFSAAIPATNPLAQRETLGLEEAVTQPHIIYPVTYRPSFADEVLQVFRSRNLHPTIAGEAKSLHAAMSMVAAGLGIALVPRSIQALQLAGVKYVDISDSDVHSHIIMSFRSRDSSPELKALRRLVVSVLESAPRHTFGVVPID